jgi:signal transduction histidine kinase
MEANHSTVTAIDQVRQTVALLQQQLAEKELILLRQEKLLAQANETIDRQTQRLIQTEKFAGIGEMLATIAHEMKNRLGIVRGSLTSIIETLPGAMEQLPLLVRHLTAAHLPVYLQFVSEMLHTSWQRMDTAKERNLRRQTAQILIEKLQINDRKAEDIANILVALRIQDQVENFLPLFEIPEILAILRSTGRFGEIRNAVSRLIPSMDALSRMVQAMARYSQPLPFEEPVWFDVCEQVEALLTLYEKQLGKQIELITEYATVPQLRGFPYELDQVWINIIINAIHAMNGEGRLTVRIFSELIDGNEFVCVSISDTGTGIPIEIQSRIFQRYFTTKAAGKGSGIGLDVCKKIVEKHQGTIWFESQPGNTTFFVRLPVSQKAEKQ